ncbi:hypothetical protein [Cellulomonas soli]
MSMEVDFASLQQATDRFRSAEAEIARGTDGAHGGAAAGFPRLIGALTAFQAATTRRIGASRTAVAGAADSLNDTTRAYQEVDAAVAETMARRDRSLGCRS